MKKIIYIFWLLIAIFLGALIGILNKTLFILPVILGGVGLAAVVVILGVFLIALYQVWTKRRIWTETSTDEKNI